MVESLRGQLDKIIWQIILDARDNPRMDFRSYKINRVDQVLNRIIERVKGIKKPWKKLTFEQTIQAVIKELGGE